ncbi:TetR family transcriptional regulator [Pseudomonas cichorii]|nr:TetR family transcriptional regulator [Pseudomonas cichorii]
MPQPRRPREHPMTRTVALRKPRARSQARIDSILDAARTLLAAEGVASLSIYSVAERAEIPPSSVYHFFASVPALLEALTADIHAAFRASLQAPIDHDQLKDWRDLSRQVELRMLNIYNADAAARQLILAQHGLTEINQADRQHDIELGHLMLEVFNRHFPIPALPDDVDVFALAMELGDRVYARSIQLHDQITPRMAEEGMRVFDTYLGLYLPPFLPKRPQPL